MKIDYETVFILTSLFFYTALIVIAIDVALWHRRTGDMYLPNGAEARQIIKFCLIYGVSGFVWLGVVLWYGKHPYIAFFLALVTVCAWAEIGIRRRARGRRAPG